MSLRYNNSPLPGQSLSLNEVKERGQGDGRPDWSGFTTLLARYHQRYAGCRNNRRKHPTRRTVTGLAHVCSRHSGGSGGHPLRGGGGLGRNASLVVDDDPGRLARVPRFRHVGQSLEGTPRGLIRRRRVRVRPGRRPGRIGRYLGQHGRGQLPPRRVVGRRCGQRAKYGAAPVCHHSVSPGLDSRVHHHMGRFQAPKRVGGNHTQRAGPVCEPDLPA